MNLSHLLYSDCKICNKKEDLHLSLSYPYQVSSISTNEFIIYVNAFKFANQIYKNINLSSYPEFNHREDCNFTFDFNDLKLPPNITYVYLKFYCNICRSSNCKVISMLGTQEITYNWRLVENNQGYEIHASDKLTISPIIDGICQNKHSEMPMFDLDFSDKTKLIKKLSTYLTFS